MTIQEQFLPKRKPRNPLPCRKIFPMKKWPGIGHSPLTDRRDQPISQKLAFISGAPTLPCACTAVSCSKSMRYRPRILNYLTSQLDLPPSLTIQVPERTAPALEQRKHILTYLGFQRFDEQTQAHLETWLAAQAHQGVLPEALFDQAESYLLARRTLLPGPSVLERLIIHVCAEVHAAF